MTGTGGWAYFSATHYMLGVRPGLEELIIDPCVPSDWKEFSINRTWRGAEYQIKVENPEGVMKGVKELRLNGNLVDRIMEQPKGTIHVVDVILG
jgi:N,N'-diacetylchitobiose phosphorylase